MKMKSNITYLEPERGNAKEERIKGKNTNTNTPGPERANPEKAREKKSGWATGKKPTRGGGEDGSA